MNPTQYFVVQIANNRSIALSGNSQIAEPSLDTAGRKQKHLNAFDDFPPREPSLFVRFAHYCLPALLIACLPLIAHGEGGSDSLRNLFGLSMNNVAVKIAELPENDSDWIVKGLDFSPDGSRLAVDSGYHKVNIWDWRSKRVEKSLDKPTDGNDSGIANPIRYSSDGRYFANCQSYGAGNITVRIWNTKDWSVAKDLIAGPSPKGAGTCTDMGFSLDGKLFVRTADIGGPGSNLIAYSTATWEPSGGFYVDAVTPVAMSIGPDNKTVAVVGEIPIYPSGVSDPIARAQQVRYEQYIYLVDVQRWKLVSTIRAGVVGPLAWSPDGTRIAITGGRGFEIFDAQSGRTLVHDNVEHGGARNVRYTPDSRYLIESDSNGMGKGLGAKIWDVQRQKVLQHVSGDVGGVAVSRDGKYLAVGMTGRTTIWQFK